MPLRALEPARGAIARAAAATGVGAAAASDGVTVPPRALDPARGAIARAAAAAGAATAAAAASDSDEMATPMDLKWHKLVGRAWRIAHSQRLAACLGDFLAES